MRTLLIGVLCAMSLVATEARADCAALLDHRFRPLAATETVHLCQSYQGRVLLVVNTASQCGFTPQYDGLEALQRRYGADGFAVLGFPSNDFGGQEPGSEEEIQEFCRLNYGVEFPMFEKVTVRGEAAHPFYQGLTEAAEGQAPAWNFHKYLIDREGKLAAVYGSRTRPDDAELVARIESLLAAQP